MNELSGLSMLFVTARLKINGMGIKKKNLENQEKKENVINSKQNSEKKEMQMKGKYKGKLQRQKMEVNKGKWKKRVQISES